ncbi:MAG: DUF721 domain-containing protein [Chlamydiia bacterium]
MGRSSSEGNPSTWGLGRQIRDLLPGVLRRIGRRVHGDRELVLATWPEIIGEALASQAKATSFDQGVLTVRVSNATLYSLLAVRDHARLLRVLRERLPNVEIKQLSVRMGNDTAGL